jgi:hypothetical protein
MTPRTGSCDRQRRGAPRAASGPRAASETVVKYRAGVPRSALTAALCAGSFCCETCALRTCRAASWPSRAVETRATPTTAPSRGRARARPVPRTQDRGPQHLGEPGRDWRAMNCRAARRPTRSRPRFATGLPWIGHGAAARRRRRPYEGEESPADSALVRRRPCVTGTPLGYGEMEPGEKNVSGSRATAPPGRASHTRVVEIGACVFDRTSPA